LSPYLLAATHVNTVVPETQLDGTIPPVRSVSTSNNYKASQITAATGLEDEDDEQPFSKVATMMAKSKTKRMRKGTTMGMGRKKIWPKRSLRM
jgi:hypothetical protein